MQQAVRTLDQTLCITIRNILMQSDRPVALAYFVSYCQSLRGVWEAEGGLVNYLLIRGNREGWYLNKTNNTLQLLPLLSGNKLATNAPQVPAPQAPRSKPNQGGEQGVVNTAVRILSAAPGKRLALSPLGLQLLAQSEHWRNTSRKGDLKRFLLRHSQHFELNGEVVALRSQAQGPKLDNTTPRRQYRPRDPQPVQQNHHYIQLAQQPITPSRSFQGTVSFQPQSPQPHLLPTPKLYQQHQQPRQQKKKKKQQQQKQQQNPNGAQQEQKVWKKVFPKRWEQKRKQLLTGTRPPQHQVKFVQPLLAYPLPAQLSKIIKRGPVVNSYLVDKELTTTYEAILQEPPESFKEFNSFAEYSKWFCYLLWAEEIQMMVDIRGYDLQATTLALDTKNPGLVRIVVPGLAEKRPSVLRGDRILAKPAKEKTLYEGYVHFVNLEDVRVSFHKSIPLAKLFKVQFSFTRTPLKMMHRAIEDAALYKRLNTDHSGNFPTLERPSGLYNKQLNEEQQLAISVIVSKPQAPCVVFGPPGTGKTVTIVEAILQVVKKDHTARVLAVAPSNEAADLVCKKLAAYKGREALFRLNAFMRHPQSVDTVVKEFSLYRGGSFQIPEWELLSSYQIIVSTCTSSGYLYSLGIKNHFTHVFIDESGEAMEPEALIALQSIKPTATIVFAGDPKQLGPIVRSSLANKYGLQRSLLERLVAGFDQYMEEYGTEEDEDDDMEKEKLSEKPPSFFYRKCGALVIQLRRSYRAHQAILDSYSDIFYAGTLQSYAPREITHSLLTWSRLPNPRFPIYVTHTEGIERREEDSPSWFNQTELELVVDIIRSLKEEFPEEIIPNQEIGVITPYRKQVLKFRQFFHSLGSQFNGIQVGVTEEFQGKEKRVIIISTVRSMKENLKYDAKFNIGFLRNPKRLNVAISRARSLLVVVGNALLLAQDTHWLEFLHYCEELGCYEGPTFAIPVEEGEADEDKDEENYLGEEGAETNVDSPWRIED